MDIRACSSLPDGDATSIGARGVAGRLKRPAVAALVALALCGCKPAPVPKLMHLTRWRPASIWTCMVWAVLLMCCASVSAQDRPQGLPTVEQAIDRLNKEIKGCGVRSVAVEIHHVAKNQPLQTLPGGVTEAYFPVTGCAKTGRRARLGFVGLYSGRKVYVEPYENHNDHPGINGGWDVRRKFRDPVNNVMLEVRPWCCNPNRFARSSDAAWLYASQDEARERVLLFSRAEMMAAYDMTYRICVPFKEPTVALGPDGRTPLWIRFFALKPDDPYPDPHCSENMDTLTIDGANVGSLIEGSRLILGVRMLIVADYKSGHLFTALPQNLRAPRMEEIIEFRDRFRRTQTCPEPDHKTGSSSVGYSVSCQEWMKDQYERALIDHFFGK